MEIASVGDHHSHSNVYLLWNYGLNIVEFMVYPFSAVSQHSTDQKNYDLWRCTDITQHANITRHANNSPL